MWAHGTMHSKMVLPGRDLAADVQHREGAYINIRMKLTAVGVTLLREAEAGIRGLFSSSVQAGA